MTRLFCLLTLLIFQHSTSLHALDLSEPDEPGQEQALNRELWSPKAGMSFDQMEAYIRQRRQEFKARRRDEIVLPTGWRLLPAGQVSSLGRLPGEAVAYQGKLAVLDNGYYRNESPGVEVFDLRSGLPAMTIQLKGLYPCARVGLDGDLYISGGDSHCVYRLDKGFKLLRSYTLPGFAAGLASVDKGHLAVSMMLRDDGKGGYGPGQLALLDLDSGRLSQLQDAGSFPHAMAVAQGKLYLSVQGEGRLRVFSLQGGSLKPLTALDLGKGPSEMALDGDTLYVVNSNSDSLSLVDTKSDRVTATWSLGKAGSRFGAAPSGCAVDADRVFVSLAGSNAVDVLEKASGKFLGAIPTGWYPTRVLEAEGRLYVVSAKGIAARRPNPPTDPGKPMDHPYVLSLLKGSLQRLPLASLAKELPVWTSDVELGSPLFSPARGIKLPIRHIFYVVKENRTYDQVLGDLPTGEGDPSLLRFPKEVTPNHHALAEDFVTLDHFFCDGEISVLGHSYTTSGYASNLLEWLGNISYAGRLEPPSPSAAKHGSFYPFGTVPALFSPDYLWDALEAKGLDYRIYGEDYYLYTRPWRILASHLGKGDPLCQRFQDRMLALSGESDRGKGFTRFMAPWAKKALPPPALVKDPDFLAGLSNYYVGDDSLAKAMLKDPALSADMAQFLGRYSMDYPSWDLDFSDLDRIRLWKRDFQADLGAGRLPQLEYIWLPNDHTAGTHGTLSPDEFVAQNDAALGILVDTLSHSKAWADSLVLVEEDDAQDGPDHLDATRTVALAAGPYVKRRKTVSDSYDQVSLLRTLELILGLDPLNAADALAAPMLGIFQKQPDLAPYSGLKPQGKLSTGDEQRYQAMQSGKELP
jgi:YVTN family beta-propeller protein